jgi:hypothetical protein
LLVFYPRYGKDLDRQQDIVRTFDLRVFGLFQTFQIELIEVQFGCRLYHLQSFLGEADAVRVLQAQPVEPIMKLL